MPHEQKFKKQEKLGGGQNDEILLLFWLFLVWIV